MLGTQYMLLPSFSSFIFSASLLVLFSPNVGMTTVNSKLNSKSICSRKYWLERIIEQKENVDERKITKVYDKLPLLLEPSKKVFTS